MLSVFGGGGASVVNERHGLLSHGCEGPVDADQVPMPPRRIVHPVVDYPIDIVGPTFSFGIHAQSETEGVEDSPGLGCNSEA